MANSRYIKLDWLTIFFFLALVGIGWVNIYSASSTEGIEPFSEFSQEYVKQLVWIGLSIVLIILILALDTRFYERFSSIIYIISLLSLIGLFIAGKNINGATSWYGFGPVGIQPSEFAKAATALALAKYISDIQTNFKTLKDQFRAFIIILLPAILIVPQPDPGSALVYSAFIFAMYREGLHFVFLLLGFFAAALFIGTLTIGAPGMIAIILAITIAIYAYNRNKKPKWSRYFMVAAICVGFTLSVNYVFNNVFE